MYFYAILAILVTLLSFNLADAYNSSVNKPTIPYEVFTIDTDIEKQSEYLGELKGDPHMYEFMVGESTELNLRLIQAKNGEIPLNIIVVKENDNKKGVKEVGRLKGESVDWKLYKDRVLGIELSESDVFEADLSSGVYRVEVSTPNNIGKYMLVIGEEPSVSGYFKTLRHVRTIQDFFGASFFTMLKSSYIYYPLGIMVLLGLIYLTWRQRHKVKN